MENNFFNQKFEKETEKIERLEKEHFELFEEKLKLEDTKNKFYDMKDTLDLKEKKGIKNIFFAIPLIYAVWLILYFEPMPINVLLQITTATTIVGIFKYLKDTKEERKFLKNKDVEKIYDLIYEKNLNLRDKEYEINLSKIVKNQYQELSKNKSEVLITNEKIEDLVKVKKLNK
jgi:hypothetical protein